MEEIVGGVKREGYYVDNVSLPLSVSPPFNT